MSKTKIAVIGVGSISNEHIPAYLQNPDVELYAFCDINEAQLKKMGEKYGVTRLYTDKDEMLKALPEIDAVSVCTWNSAHAPCAIAALNAGKHVLCEKPMATSAEEAMQMLDAAKKNGKTLMIGFVRRFNKDTRILQEFINTNYFGDFYYGKTVYLRRNGNPGGWFGDKSRSAGGPVIDLGVHIIDQTRYLMGNPKPVSVYGATFQKLFDRSNIKTPKAYKSVSASDNDVCDVEDLASAMIRYDNGAVLHIEVSFSLNLKKGEGYVQMFGDKGGFKLEDDTIEFYTELNDYMADVNLAGIETLSKENPFANEINHFVECVRTGIPCRAPAEDGVEIMRILDAIYESARTGHEVVLG